MYYNNITTLTYLLINEVVVVTVRCHKCICDGDSHV